MNELEPYYNLNLKHMNFKGIAVLMMGTALSVSVNAQSWKSNSYGLYNNPLTGNTGNVSIGITPTSSTASYKLYVKGAEYLTGALTVGTTAKVNSSLTVSGKSFLSAVTASGDIYGKAKLTVDGYTYLNGQSTLVGKTTMAGGFTATSPCTISSSLTTSSLTVSGASTLTGAATLKGSATIQGSFLATGSSNKFYNGLTVMASNDNNRTNLRIETDYSAGMKLIANGYRDYTNLSFQATTYSFFNRYGTKVFELNNDNVKVNSSLDVTGKITCHNEIEVANVLKADKIQTQDINVEMNHAADYVFAENYNLKSLSEVESYVKENKHLPGVPSAAEMAENGMNVAEMSNLLLEKIEELTLHMIQLQKENQALKAEVEMLKK